MKKETLDRIVITLMLAAMFLAMCVVFASAETEAERGVYANVGIVTRLDEGEDLVYVEDCVGFVWCFEGIEDWSIGDMVAMVFDDMGTELIFDDEIISVRYIAWVER